MFNYKETRRRLDGRFWLEIDAFYEKIKLSINYND
jgi:hypothetical protein